MSNADYLLITANPFETRALLDVFEQASGAKAAAVTINQRVYRNLGVVNGARVFHARTEQGSGGVGGAQQSVDKAIRALAPRAVIAVGIAFGVNERKQKLGDILLSKQLRPYDLQRVGPERIVLRGDKPHASAWLIDLFEGVAHSTWTGAKIRSGAMLTGESLIDSLDYRSELVGYEPEAIGGEMEGAGLYVACHDHKTDWIVIKSICDWGDGTINAVDDPVKDARQQVAAHNAAEFVLHTLQAVPFESPLSESAKPSGEEPAEPDFVTKLRRCKKSFGPMQTYESWDETVKPWVDEWKFVMWDELTIEEQATWDEITAKPKRNANSVKSLDKAYSEIPAFLESLINRRSRY